MYPSYPAADLVRTLIRSAPQAVFRGGSRRPSRRCGGAPSRPLDSADRRSGRRHHLDALRALGRDGLARDPELLGALRTEVQPSDSAILYLTSGATGEPKMALVTHQAIVANLDMGPVVLPIGPQDSTVAFLPSAHIAQRVVIELLPLRFGMPVTFFESL